MPPEARPRTTASGHDTAAGTVTDAAMPAVPRARNARTREVVVASVPASHVYVRHIAAEQPDGVRRLADPDPDDATRSTEQRWWPPVMLDPAWVRSHDFDVFHVQFGFDAWTPEQLREVADAVHDTGRRLAYTVHDLRNPHHATPDLHLAQVQVLVEQSDALITLTEGAADGVERRWGRRPLVLPHPHVVELDTMRAMAARERPDRPFTVGLHLKSLRAGMDPWRVLPTLVDAVAAIPGAVLRVDGHRDVLEPGGASYDAELAASLRAGDRDGVLELHVHDYFSDDDLWEYLWGLDVSVLPYRFGTHSGWLEACRDLGTAVVASTCGYYAEQGPVHSYVLDEDRWEPATLRAAVAEAHAAGRPDPLSVQARREQRAMLAAVHRGIYLGEITAGTRARG